MSETHEAERRRAIRKRLEELERDGRLTPADVIDDARDPESPLHEEFEWDHEKAAYHAWTDRARALIRSVKYEFHTETVTINVPRYLRDPDAPSDEQGYISVPRLLTERERARRALISECGRATTVLERAKGYAAVLGFPDDVDRLIVGLRALADRGEESEAA